MTSITPDFKEFTRLARKSSLVPVLRSVSADLLTPVSAFLSIAAAEPHAFLLESVEGGEKEGRYTFLGARPYMRLIGRGGRVWVGRGRHPQQHTGPARTVCRKLPRRHPPADVPGLPPFTAGAV